MLNNENIYLFILQGDGKIKLGPFEKAYKDYVSKMTQLTKLGFVDIDFVTNGNNNDRYS